MARRCLSRHMKCWLVCGGGLIWCWECGAIRQNVAKGHPAYESKWNYPVGPDAENPYTPSTQE